MLCLAWFVMFVSDTTMANSTVMFSGINPEGRNSSKVLRPPGGGSSLGPFSADCEEITTTKAPPAKTEVPPPAEEKIRKDEVTITEKSCVGCWMRDLGNLVRPSRTTDHPGLI